MCRSYAGPLYTQVAAVLRQKIISFEWEPSKAIPNELALARQLNVSVGTVRKALERLAEERLIKRFKGRGTVVVDPSDQTEMDRFCQLYVGDRKLRARQSSILIGRGQATPIEASRLGLRPKEDVYRIDRVMIEPGIAIIKEKVVVSASLFPELDKAIDRSYGMLFPVYRHHYDIFVTQTAETVQPMKADREIADFLRVPEGEPILVIDRMAIAFGRGPVEWAVQHVNAINAQYKTSTQ